MFVKVENSTSKKVISNWLFKKKKNWPPPNLFSATPLCPTVNLIRVIYTIHSTLHKYNYLLRKYLYIYIYGYITLLVIFNFLNNNINILVVFLKNCYRCCLYLYIKSTLLYLSNDNTMKYFTIEKSYTNWLLLCSNSAILHLI